MSKRKRKENPDLKSSCLKEIEELSKEINCLEDALEVKQSRLAEFFSDEALCGIIERLRGRHSSTKNSKKKSSEQQELQSLLSRTEKLESLTGIIFDKNKAELISSSDGNNNNDNKKWRRILSGKCFSLSFLMELETEEIPEEEEVTAANVEKEIEDQESITVQVTKLSFKVSCPLAAKELNSFTKAAEQEKAIGTTFIALKQYAKWYDCRRKTFSHFKTKYHDLVCIFDGLEKSDTMEIRNQLHNGLHFIIQWSISTSNDGYVLPQIDAFAACPSKAQPEIESVLNSTPEQFRKMLCRFGIEQAIECVIMIVQ